MKILISIILTIVIGYIASLILPWWSIVVVALLVAMAMNQKSLPSFAAGFIGAALLWGVYAAVLNSGNEGILAAQLGALFGGLSGLGLIGATAVLAGLIGGMGALTGSLGRSVFGKA